MLHYIETGGKVRQWKTRCGRPRNCWKGVFGNRHKGKEYRARDTGVKGGESMELGYGKQSRHGGGVHQQTLE